MRDAYWYPVAVVEGSGLIWRLPCSTGFVLRVAWWHCSVSFSNSGVSYLQDAVHLEFLG